MLLNTAIRSLGPGQFRSPLQHGGLGGVRFCQDGERVLHDHNLARTNTAYARGEAPVSFEVAGPRERLFFDPAKTTAGIVTCGGLCPGLNDVISSLVMALHHRYQVTRTYGFRSGYQGLSPRYAHTPLILRPEALGGIPAFGGSILGTSRGPQDPAEMVNLLEEMSVDQLYVVGGDGTLRGAADFFDEMERLCMK